MAAVTAHPRAMHGNLATVEADLSFWSCPAVADWPHYDYAVYRQAAARPRKAFARWLCHDERNRINPAVRLKGHSAKLQRPFALSVRIRVRHHKSITQPGPEVSDHSRWLCARGRGPFLSRKEEQKEALTIWKPRFGTSAMFKRIRTWQTRTKPRQRLLAFFPWRRLRR